MSPGVRIDGQAQVDAYPSLLAKAQALSSSVDVAQFLIAASDLSHRPVAAELRRRQKRAAACESIPEDDGHEFRQA